jgi:hypothetical protein
MGAVELAPPLGSIITPPGQYTHCVKREDYRDVPGVLDEGAPTILEFLLCDYLLGGKLVCLGGDQCAIGIVVGLEQVGAGKSGFDAIDNDFSFNLLLAPYTAADFAHYGKPVAPENIVDPRRTRDDVAVHSPQGRLLLDAPSPSPLPAPVDQTGAPGPPLGKKQPQGRATWPNDGYGVLWRTDGVAVTDPGFEEGNNLHKLWDKPPDKEWPEPPPAKDGDFVSLPVLHCECEGSRICFVCQALKPFLEAMQGKIPGTDISPSKACHAVAEWMPWPLNKIVKAICSLVEDIIAVPIGLALAPAMAAAMATAWEAAQIFDDLFVTGPVAKQIHVGDVVIVTGRWVWDAGHSGHTELHPVKTIQKLMTPPHVLPPEVRPAGPDYDPRNPLPARVTDEIARTHDEWCRLASEPPPPFDPRQPGGLSDPQLASLAPAQHDLYNRQRQPENSWSVHPLIDGCQPRGDREAPR